MNKKLIFILPIALLISLIFLVPAKAAGEPAQCAINSGLNISDGVPGPTISGTAPWFNWTVTMATSNSSILNVTNVTFFRNDTREILCQNISLRVNSTTRGNCTLDSTTLVDDDVLTVVAEAYETNRTGGLERCTNLSFMITVNVNNTAPSITGAAGSGKIFTGLRGLATDNLSIIVDNATRNCTLTIGNAQGESQQLRTVITKGPSVANCTYQPAFSSTLPDGSYWIRWSAFDGLDTRFSDFFYSFQLKEGGGNAADTPTVEIASQVGQTATQNKKNMMTAAVLIVIIGGLVWWSGNKK